MEKFMISKEKLKELIIEVLDGYCPQDLENTTLPDETDLMSDLDLSHIDMDYLVIDIEVALDDEYCLEVDLDINDSDDLETVGDLVNWVYEKIPY